MTTIVSTQAHAKAMNAAPARLSNVQIRVRGVSSAR
jgi:hypothetical protein